MIVFLLCLMPLFYWGIQYLFDNDNVRMADRVLPFFLGLLAAVPIVLMQWALDVYFPLNWTPAGIYFFALLNKEGFILYPFLVLLIIIFKKKSYSGIPMRELTGWFCGYYFMFSLSESLILRGAVNPYDAVLNPVIRLIYILSFTTILIRFLHEKKTNIKILYLILYLILPLIFNFLPVLSILNKSLFFYIMLLICGTGTVFFYLMESRGKLL